MRVDSFAKLEMLLVLQKNKPLLLSKKSSFECIIGGELTDDNFFRRNSNTYRCSRILLNSVFLRRPICRLPNFQYGSKIEFFLDNSMLLL